MIAGLLVRNFKVFNNINFIPLIHSSKQKLSVLTGNNGTGKSSVLEALDCFFNNRKTWNINKDGKQTDAFIVPVFLMLKQRRRINNPKTVQIMEDISNYFWEFNNTSANSEAITSFWDYRDQLKNNIDYERYFFLPIGEEYQERKTAYFSSSFNSAVRLHLDDKNYTEQDYLSVKIRLKKNHPFIYIPVENSVSAILKLETREMQSLIGEDITSKIDNSLKEKSIKVELQTANKPTKKTKKSIVDLINDELNNFIDMVQVDIKNTDSSYSFTNEGRGNKKNLTAADIREHIFRAFFSIRTLKKNKKEIYQLSSGEQRIALIDIAFSFLANSNSYRKVILAIDEPESSMHTAMCLKQFKRLSCLANEHHQQVLLTTHWYGFIPFAEKGAMHHFQKDDNGLVKTSSFELSTLTENRKDYPNDIQIKSFFDLSASILTIIKQEKTNFLICEGADDANYLRLFIDERDIHDVIVLPVGGCGNVIKVYKLLYSALDDKTERNSLKGKAFCLVDTDLSTNILDLYEQEKFMTIRRLQKNDDDIDLIRLTSHQGHSVTSIEDCLNPRVFYDCVGLLIKEKSDDEMRELWEHFQYNSNTSRSFVNQEDSFLEATDIASHRRKKEIVKFIMDNDNKYILSEKYVEKVKALLNLDPEKHDELLWMDRIIQYFKTGKV